MKAVLVLLLGSCFVSSFGQTAQEAPSRVAGIVVTSNGGEPLAHARVSLNRDDAQQSQAFFTTTGADGRFVLTNIPSGRYHLTATQPGFVEQEYGQDQPNQAGVVLDLTSHQTVDDVVLRMTEGGVITGRVVDQEGHPLQVVVQLFARRYRDDGQSMLDVEQGRGTNDLGEYRMYWVPPGTYYVNATAPLPSMMGPGSASSSAVDQSPDPPDVFAPTFYPDAPDDAHATPITVGPGAQLRGIDFSLTRSKTVRVAGHVVDQETGLPVADATITLRPNLGFRLNLRQTAQTDAKGDFEIRNLPPAAYTVTTLKTLPTGRTVFDERDVEVGSRGVSDLELALRPFPGISGHVVIEANEPMPEDKTILLFNSLGAAIGSSADGATYGTGVEKDGAFRLANVQPGLFRLQLTGMADNYFIRSAISDGKDILSSGLDLRASSADSVRVVVAATGGTLDGSVEDDQRSPVMNAHVVLVPSRRERIDLFKSVTTDRAGQFTLKGVVPGDYKLFAWRNIKNNIYFDPQFMERFESRGVSLHVDENGHATVLVRILAADQDQ